MQIKTVSTLIISIILLSIGLWGCGNEVDKNIQKLKSDDVEVCGASLDALSNLARIFGRGEISPR